MDKRTLVFLFFGIFVLIYVAYTAMGDSTVPLDGVFVFHQILP